MRFSSHCIEFVRCSRLKVERQHSGPTGGCHRRVSWDLPMGLCTWHDSGLDQLRVASSGIWSDHSIW